MSNFYKKLFSLLAILGITGCVSVKQIPMTTATANQIKNKQISITKRAMPDFAATTPGKAVFGAIGGAAMISAGNEIISKNNIEDPANYISEKLTSKLNAKLGTKVSNKTVKVTTDDVKKMAKDSTDADLVLDIRTINWSFVYYPTSLNTYRVLYNARLRLIDVKNGAVLAEGGCHHIPKQTPNSPSYDALLKNNAERLKKELHEAADYCIDELESKVLKI